MDPAMKATHSLVLEPNADLSSCESGAIEPPDSSLVAGSEPRASVPIESEWAPIMEFTAVDIFHHSPWVTC